MSVAKAIESIKQMDLLKQRKIAKLIGLPVTDNDKEEVVFNAIYTMISKGTVDSGEYKGQNSVDLFNRIAGMTDKFLNVRSLVREALVLRVLGKRQGVIYEGETVIATSEEELIAQLALDSKQMELLALETRVADKKKMRNAIENFEYVSPLPAEEVVTTTDKRRKGSKAETNNEE